MCVCACMCVCMCVCACICVYVCVCVCGCLFVYHKYPSVLKSIFINVIGVGKYLQRKRVFNILFIFTNLSTRTRYDTRSIFKWSLTGLNSEFSFS